MYLLFASSLTTGVYPMFLSREHAIEYVIEATLDNRPLTEEEVEIIEGMGINKEHIDSYVKKAINGR